MKKGLLIRSRYPLILIGKTKEYSKDYIMKTEATLQLTASDFREALTEVILPKDDVIVIYAGIWSFAGYFNNEIQEIPNLLLDTIEEVIGENRTILFPTFCASDFVKTRKYDLVRSKPKESGILSERALLRKGFMRTNKPMHSFAVKGPRASEVMALPCTTSWGPESLLAWLGSVNARICPLGLSWHKACSYFHRIEETLQVPYRYYKRFSGILYDDGKEIGPCEEIKYSYSLQVPLDYDYSVIQAQLNTQKMIISCQNPLIPLESAVTSDIDIVCHKVFKSDPYAIIKNKDVVKEWVESEKNNEVTALALNEKHSLPEFAN